MSDNLVLEFFKNIIRVNGMLQNNIWKMWIHSFKERLTYFLKLFLTYHNFEDIHSQLILLNFFWKTVSIPLNVWGSIKKRLRTFNFLLFYNTYVYNTFLCSYCSTTHVQSSSKSVRDTFICFLVSYLLGWSADWLAGSMAGRFGSRLLEKPDSSCAKLCFPSCVYVPIHG